MGEGFSLPLYLMNSKEIFISKIDELSKVLDELGLYVINMNLGVIGQDSYESYDSLRNEIINNKSMAYVDVVCFIGNQAWRESKPGYPYGKTMFLDMAEIEISDIAQYLKNSVED